MLIEKYKISVIIPVYNAHKHLNQCIDSVLNQTLKDVEIVCVDDCSTDISMQLLKKYEESFSNVRVFQTAKNSGAGVVQNLGIKNVTGEFLCFLGDDDFYANNGVLKMLYDNAINNNVNASAGNILSIDGISNNKLVDHWSHINFFKDGIMEYKDYPYPEGYVKFIFKTEIIRSNNISFPDYRRRQDPVFFARAMSAIKEFYCTTEEVYVYRINHKAKKWNKDIIDNSIKSIDDCIKIYETGNYTKHIENEKKHYNMYIEMRKNLHLHYRIWKRICRFINKSIAVIKG